MDAEASACAFPESNRIVIVDLSQGRASTVMMHEMGHLLGVPHIFGDSLMDPMYHGPVDKPSPAAVALAKLAETEKGKGIR
jgi:hypothetical protein